jgi:hypothetical protein
MINPFLPLCPLSLLTGEGRVRVIPQTSAPLGMT